MQITPAASALPSTLVDALKRNAARAPATPASGVQPGASFSGALDKALHSVSASQNEASRMASSFQLDPSQVSLEQTMVSMQKSQIAFQSALHVRNRLVSAYTDIMNMPV